ncbi:MAG: hypothetical protein V4714_14815 [Bacteroidota bacterium]
MKPFLSLLLLLFLASCSKEELVNACTTENPAEKVIWLKKKVNLLEKSPYCNTIRQFNYHGQTVFVVGTCEPNFNSIDQIYDCQGNLVCGWGDQQCPDFEKEAKFEKVIWPSKN